MTPGNRRSKLQDIQQIADSLRADAPIGADGDAPDFTDAIIQRVHAQRPFLTRRTRRLVVACRYGAAVAVVLTIGGVVLVRATSPQVAELVTPLQPVTFSPVVDSVRDTTTQAVNNVRRGLREISTLTDPARHAVVLTNYVGRPAHAELKDAGTLVVGSSDAPSDQSQHSFMTYSVAALPIDDGDNSMYYSTFDGAYDGIANASGPSRPSSLKNRPRFFYFPEPYSLRPVSRPDCSLLDDFAPLITGQPACDGFVPQ